MFFNFQPCVNLNTCKIACLSYFPLQIWSSHEKLPVYELCPLIYSHLVYVIQIWGSAYDSHLKKIIVLQKRSLRLIVYDDYNDMPCPLAAFTPIFSKLEILQLNDICIFQISRFIHNCLNLSLVISNTGSNLMRFITTIRSKYQIAHNINSTNSLFNYGYWT